MSGNEELHRQGHEAFNRRDREAIRALLSPGFTFTDHPRGLTMKTAEEYLDWLDEWTTGFPDALVSEARYVDAGNTTVAQYIGRGTNTGMMGPAIETGKRISLPACEVFTYDERGLAITGEVYYDTYSMLLQLGLADAP